jgi:pimeloyl-ACP methyl ester carboxylesterase/phosphohistidine swiveling domain-containing protein
LEKRFRPVLVEVAGQGGRQDAPVPSTLAGFAEDLAEELEQARRGAGGGGNPETVFYGQGIGGLVLAHALARLPSFGGRVVLHAPVGAHLARRRLPRLMAWFPLQSLVHALLRSSITGSLLAGRLFDPAGESTPEDRRLFAEGYRRARSFGALFAATDPLSALDGLEALTLPITLLWGLEDRVLGPHQLPAWAEILANAPVTARLVPGWRHYPYLDHPEAFAGVLAECAADRLPEEPCSLDALHFYCPRTKAGRLAGMRRAGLPVPHGWWVPPAALENGTAARLFQGLQGRYAVRSSANVEDQADHTAAGVFTSLLHVAPADLMDACRKVVASGAEAYLSRLSGETARVDVLVQEMVAPRAGGVAWVRGLGVDLEIAQGRMDAGVSGEAPMVRASLSRLGRPWTLLPDALPGGLDEPALRRRVWPALRRVHALFDCGTLDVEWAVDEQGKTRLLQARPVGERHGARRLLSAANLREIVPPDPSPFFVSAIERAGSRLPRYYARHDPWTSTWREPFTVSLGGRAYLNADFLTAVMDRWGLPRFLVSRGVGGRLPEAPLRPDRFLLSLPALFRLLADFTRVYPGSGDTLSRLRAELEAARGLPALARWFERAFMALVTENFRITGALTAALPVWPLKAPEVVTARMARELASLLSEADRREFEARWGHRGEYESDPRMPRGEEARGPAGTLSTAPRTALPDPLLTLPAPLRRFPMLAPPHLLAHREWFRDSAMRLWAAFRARVLQEAACWVARGVLDSPEEIWLLATTEVCRLPPDQWRERVTTRREAGATPAIPADLFWSDTLEALGSTPLGRLPLVPGTVTGPALVARTPSEARALLDALPTAGERPVLLAPAVDPGWLPVFVRVGGVATELGGRLSHAATLLRELAIPSVLNLPGVMEAARTGERVRLRVPPGSVELCPDPALGV